MEFRRVASILLIVWLLIPLGASAQDSLNVSKVGAYYDYWQGLYNVTVQENIAVVATYGTGIHFLDITDPSNPTKVGFIDVPYSNHYFYEDDYLYIMERGVLGTPDLKIFDVSDLNNPIEISSTPFTESVHDFVYNQGILYLTYKLFGEDLHYIQPIDVSSPENPVFLNTYSNGDFISHISVRENLIYYATCDSTRNNLVGILDKSDPSNIIVVSRTLASDDVHFYYTSNLLLDGDNAYVKCRDCVVSYDISNPESPDEQDMYEKSNIKNISTYENYLFIQTLGGITVFDVSQPLDMVFVREIEPEDIFETYTDSYFRNHNVTGSLLTIIDGKQGYERGINITFFDISDINDFTEIGHFSNSGRVRELYAYEENLAVFESDSVQILDVSLPDQPEKRGVIYECLNDVFVKGNYLYGIHRNYENDVNIRLYNISDINSPVFSDSIRLGNGIYSMTASDRYLFTAGGNFETNFCLYSIESPSGLPELIDGNFDDNFLAYSVAIDGDYIYVAGGYSGTEIDKGLVILEIDDNGLTHDIGSVRIVEPGENENRLKNISYDNNLVLLYSYHYFALIDVSNPSNPEFVYGEEGEHNITFENGYIFDDFLYMMTPEKLQVYNISNPSSPELVGYYNDERFGYYSYAKENQVYFSNNHRIYALNTERALPVDQKSVKSVPLTYFISKAYPNPFNPSLNVQVSLPETGLLRLTVHNVLGQEVAVMNDQSMSAGNHTFTFNGSDLSSGIYFVKAVVEGKMNDVQKVVLMK